MSRGITSRQAFEHRSHSDQAHYLPDLEVRDLERSGAATSFRQAYLKAYGHAPRGRDYERVERNLASAYERQGRRLRVKANDFLWVSDESMPILTPDGIYDAVPERMSHRQRSLIGQYWSIVAQARTLDAADLTEKLRPFRGETLRVYDPETGKVIRLPFETDPERLRAFAASPEARQERVISPRLSQADLAVGT